MKPIRVLNVVTFATRGGIENRLMDIYRNIDRERIQFDFLVLRENPGCFHEEIKSLGGRIFCIGPLTVKSLFNSSKLRSFFLSHPEYKIVHEHVCQWSGVILKNAKHAGIPVRIAHSRVSLLEKINVKNMLKNVIKLLVNTNLYATHRFAVSQKAGHWLYGKKAVKNGKVTVWPNAIDSNKFKYNVEIRYKMRSELGLNDAFVLIHVGNFRYQKNHTFLIDVFDDLAVKVPNSKLLLVGEDHMNGQVQNYAAEKKSAADIIFLGLRSDIAELLQAGDLFVLPSFYEGFPGTVLEAQAAGLPCIISNTITNEVCLTDNISRMPINKGTGIWVNKILEFKDTVRTEVCNTINSKGYDIFVLCERLTEFYENIAGRA